MSAIFIDLNEVENPILKFLAYLVQLILNFFTKIHKMYMSKQHFSLVRCNGVKAGSIRGSKIDMVSRE